MSAVLKEVPPPTSDTARPGIHLTGEVQADLLSPAAEAFLVDLHRRFERRRRQCLAARAARQARFDAGELPDFRADTRAIRERDWRVAPLPEALQDRRVEITGPVDPKMIINALNSGANCFMADLEDSTAPVWENIVGGHRALREAAAGTLTCEANGKRYALRPFDERAVLLVRPRGWHLEEKHAVVDGERMSASLFDAGLFLFHSATTLAAIDRGPYLYLPKLESMEEAVLWDDALAHMEQALGLSEGQVKVTVLIETLPAVFEMDEILYALRGRIAGLNCGRWDYIFSYIKTFRRHRNRVLPERGQVTMIQPFLKAYSELLIQTCHRRGAHAMGGMAAQIPVSGDPEANERALARVRGDKLREVTAGHDGTWVAHPALIPVAREVFDERMPIAHQQHVLREDVLVIRDDLVEPALGTITRAGFENNIEVCVRYLAAWLDGSGCVPIHWLMEDAATAEIARVQLWQWLHHAAEGESSEPLYLEDGTAIDFVLFDAALLNVASRLSDPSLPGAGRMREALAMLEELTRRNTLEDFLTVPAYERL